MLKVIRTNATMVAVVILMKLNKPAIDLVTNLFGCNYANVQPHSGSSANMIAYASVLNFGDKILSLSLDQGGSFDTR